MNSKILVLCLFIASLALSGCLSAPSGAGLQNEAPYEGSSGGDYQTFEVIQVDHEGEQYFIEIKTNGVSKTLNIDADKVRIIRGTYEPRLVYAGHTSGFMSYSNWYVLYLANDTVIY